MHHGLHTPNQQWFLDLFLLHQLLLLILLFPLPFPLILRPSSSGHQQSATSSHFLCFNTSDLMPFQILLIIKEERIMFEALITKVLNKVLGDFIENLQPHQLDISLLKGDVNLLDMKLRADLFASLPLPFALVFGKIGRIHIRIPPLWRLQSEALIIEISDILAIIRPKHVKEWSEEVEIKEYQEKQRKRLEKYELIQENARDAVEYLTQSQNSQSDQDSATPQSQESKIDQLVDKIIDNLQINIRNIYVRYEDSYSSPHSGKFAVGILLQELVTYTTDSQWKNIVMQEGAQEFTHKLLKLTNFSVFLDFHDQYQSTRPVNSIVPQEYPDFKEVIQKEFRNPHNYILDSFSMEARLLLNKKPDRNKKPKITVDVILGGQFYQLNGKGIGLTVHSPQIVRVTKLIEYIGFFSDFQQGATQDFEDRPLDQDTANSYINLYTEFKDLSQDRRPHSREASTISTQVSLKVHIQHLKSQLDAIEANYSADKIILLRSFGMKLIQQRENENLSKSQIIKQVQEKRSQITKWGGLFTSRDEEIEQDKEIQQFKKKLESSLQSKLLHQKAELDLELTRLTDELSQNTSYLGKFELSQLQSPDEQDKKSENQEQDFLTLDLTVTIPTFKLAVINEYAHPVVEIKILKQVSLIQIGSKFKLFEFSMNALIAKDLWTKACVEFSNIIETRDIENEGEVSSDLCEEEYEAQMVKIDREKRALIISLESQANDEIPTKLSISSERTLFIIPVFQVINEAIRTLSNAFKSEEIDMNYYHEAATEKALEFMNKGKQLLNSIKKGDYEHSAINMSVHLFAPMILVSEDYFNIKKPCILIDSGVISLKSNLIPPEHFKGINLKSVSSASNLYDRYECGFSDFQINLLPYGLPQGGTNQIFHGCGTQIIKKLNIHLEFLNCLEPMHPLYPTLEMVFIVQNFEVLASFAAFYTVMRIQERYVDTIINDEELIFQKPQVKGNNQTVEESKEESWERFREEARKKSTLKRAEKMQSSKLSGVIDEKQEKIQEEKKQRANSNEQNEKGTDTSFRMFFSVEKFQVIIYHDVNSERFKNQTTMEKLFDVSMLNLGVEIDLDRKNDIHVNTNVYKLSIEDIHKKSKLADQFRIVLSSQIPDLPQQYFGRRYKYLEVGLMKKSLLSIIEAELLSKNYILNELRPSFNMPSNIEHQVDVRISLFRAKHEISIKVVISDIKLVFTLPTTSKIQQILKELDRTFEKLDVEKLKDRKAKLQMYEYVLLHCLCKHKSSIELSKNNKEQEFLMRLFSNFARDNKLDPRINQSEIRDGLQRIQTIWDMRRLQKEQQEKEKIKKKESFKGSRKQSIVMGHEKKEIVKTKLKVTAAIKSFQVWIPLYADTENSQLLQLSLVSDFSLLKNSIEEYTIDIELDETVEEDVHESRTQMVFAVSQLTVQIVQCKDLLEQISPRKSPRKYSKSSLSEEEQSSDNSGEEFNPLMQSFKRRQMIVPPTRISMKVQSYTNFKPDERGKSEINLQIDPIAIQIGFKHIDFFNIIMMQIDNTLAFFDKEGEESQFGTDKMGSPRKIASPSKIKEEIKESETQIKKQLQIEEQKEPKFSRYNNSENKSPIDLTEIKIRLDSLTVSLNDDSSKLHYPLFLAELKTIKANLNKAQYKEDAGAFILKKLGLWPSLNPSSVPHLELKSSVFMQMSYYNPRSLSFEPLLEKWDFGLDILQIAPYTQQKITFHSENFFNLNLTFGMALTLRKILERLEKSFKHSDVMRKVEEGRAVSADEFEMTLDWRRKMLEEQDLQEFNGSAEMRHQELSGEPGFIFQNQLGLDVKFALHDEFSDDNLESSIFNVEYDFRRQSIHQRSTNNADGRKVPFFTLSAYSSEMLQKSYAELVELQNETLTFRSGGLKIEQLEEDPLRLDFKFRGLTKIQAVPIENIGVHSYEAKITDLLSTHQIIKRSIFRSPLRGQNEIQMTCGVIVNITLEGNQKKISLESQVIIRNNTRTPIKIFVKTALQQDQDLRKDQIADINPESQFKVPLHWLISDTKLSMYMSTIQGDQLLFKNLAKTFTSQRDVARISEKHSKIVKVNFDHYASLDIQGYNCYPKSTIQFNPPQYVVSFNYPLMISNYNFHPLELNALSHLNQEPIARMAPKETAYIDSLDLVTAHMNIQWIIHESSTDKYTLSTHHFDVALRSQWHSQGGSLEKFKDQTGKKKIKLFMEVRKIHHTQLASDSQDQDNQLESFQLREKIMDFSCSFQVMLYPKYMVVNKTSLQLHSEKQTFEPFSNSYFNINYEKASFKATGYKNSDSLNINTVGISGILAMDVESKDHISLEKIIQGKEYVPQRLDCGLSISTASSPFNKTLIISITPRYQLINHLNIPLVVKQKNKSNQILFRGASMSYFFESKKERFIMIREPSNEEISSSKIQGDLANDENWSSPFSIDDVEDFQVSYPKTMNFTSYFREQTQKWYEPNRNNDFQRFVRVLVKTQNEATIQIVFTNPQNPEYEIINRSGYDLIFGQVENDTILKQIQNLKLLEQKFDELVVAKKLFNLPHHSKVPFAWVQRVQSNRLVGLKLGSTQQLLEIDLEKAVQPYSIISKDGELRITAEVKVSGYSKKLIFSNISEEDASQENHNKIGQLFLQNLLKKLVWHKQSIKFKIKGIGLSFIDETPQELLYFTFHGLKLSFYQWLEPKNIGESSDDWSNECQFDLNSKIRGSLKHLQLDNMISQTMPVILIPSKPLTKSEKDGHMMMEERIKRQMDEEIKEEEEKEHGTQNPKTSEEISPPFIQFIVSYAESTGNQNSSFRLRTLQFAMQEFIFQIDTSIFNSNLKFVMELIDTFSESSQSKVIRATSESFHKFRHTKREDICEDLNAQQAGLQTVIDLPEKEKNNLANKMYIELIHLGAIKAIITFRLEKRAVELDIADPAKGFGAANLFYTLFAAVASISQSPMTFKELILIDTFATQDSLTNQLLMNYVRQGIMQFYKLIASSDIIGNPLGLVNKLGTGVYEFVSEPSKGLLKGTDEFVGGVGKGVQSLVSNVISGSFESVSKITGSLYTVVKNVSGEKNAQIRRTEHIGEGIYYGVKGGVKELVQGVTGIVTKPIQKTREEGAKGFFKGLGSGLVGAIAAPVTATLRAGTSVTQGVAASATSLGMIGKKVVDTQSMQSRFRPPRYISAKGVMQEYDEDLALVRQILVTKYFGQYGGDSIKFYSLLPLTKKNGIIKNNDPSSSILIITETMLLYFRLDTSDKKRGSAHRIFKTRLRKIQVCELFKVHILGQQTTNKRRTTQSGISIYHIVLTCYSQVNGQKKFTLVSNDYSKFEKIYKLLSVLPFCEAVNRVKKQRNSKVLGLVGNKKGA